MTTYLIGFSFGALIITFVIRYALLRVVRTWEDGYRKYLFANFISCLLVVLIGLSGAENDNPFWIHIVAQFIWLIFDVTHHTISKKALTA